jgi:O-antigen/teichoic acid export membrane protein
VVSGFVSVRQLAKRLAAGGIGQLMATAALTALPFVGRAYLTTGDFAFWTLLVTVASTTVVLDFGGTPLIMMAQDRVQSLPKLLAASIGLSCMGSLLIGAIAFVAWVFYSKSQSSITFAFGASQIAWVTLGGVVRSIVACIGASALVDNRMRARTAILGTQAALQVAITWLLLGLGVHAAAFALGLVISSTATCIAALPVMAAIVKSHIPGPYASPMLPGERLRTFLGWRTAAILLGAVITQADRWVIGAIAGATLLANYEIAYRIATLPKVVALAIGVGITSEAARAEAEPGALQQLYHHSLRIIVAQILVFACVITPLGLFVGGLIHHVTVHGILVMAVTLAIAHAINGATAPGTYMCLGIGKPIWEVPYLAWTCAVLCSGWLVSGILHSGTLAVVTPILGIALGSVYFLAYFPRRLATV